MVVEAGRNIHDDPVVTLTQELDHLAQVRWGDEIGSSGDGGARSTRIPVEWSIMTDSRMSLSGSPPSTASSIDLFFGLRLSKTPTSPNWRLASRRATRWLVSRLSASARFVARVVRPTPPLGEKTAMTW